MLLGDAQGADPRARVEPNAETLDQLFRILKKFPPVEDAGNHGRLAAEEDVFCRREMGNQVEFLVDYADAQFLRLPRAGDLNPPSVDENFAAVFPVGPAQDFHQRGLARAVFPQQHMDFSPRQVEAHLIERHDTRECFADVPQFQYWLILHEPRKPVAKHADDSPVERRRASRFASDKRHHAAFSHRSSTCETNNFVSDTIDGYVRLSGNAGRLTAKSN